MYNSNSSRNPWGGTNELFNQSTSIDELKKSIREQKILLDAFGEDSLSYVDHQRDANANVGEMKRRIISLTQEMYDRQQMAASTGRSTLSPAQWWARYQLNLRQLEDIADQRHVLLKEIDYLVGTSIKNLQEELDQEMEKLHKARVKANQVKRAAYSVPYINCDQPGMTESERIRAKAQAMVAARLGKSNSSTTSLYGDRTDDDGTKTTEINRLIEGVRQIQKEVDSIVENDLTSVDNEIDLGNKQLKDRQMFEQGLYVDDELARFIDMLDSSLITTSEKRSYDVNKKLPPPPPPPLYTKSASPYSHSPPPIPTSQRPGTPRSEADIKAEAHKRIEQRKLLFSKNNSKSQTFEDKSRPIEENNISEEERAAQEKMRQAEISARARLDVMREKRNTLRKEAAAADEKKRKVAAEASAAAEAEMLAEKKTKQKEEEERAIKIKKAQDEYAAQQRILREVELERLRLEREERKKKEAEERQKRDEEECIAEEIRQKKARKAAEQAAQEKRLRIMEIERREKEIEAARREENNRRKLWEEAENQKRLEEERLIREKEEEAARVRQRLDEEDARIEEQRRHEEDERRRLEEEAKARKKAEEERIEMEKRREEQALHEAEMKLQEEKKQEEIRKRQQEAQELAATCAEEAEAAAAVAASKEVYSSSPTSTHLSIQNSTTAGTSGYGIDVEDEVNFSIIYRVKTLYEYQGVREDDLSFSANETLKAHPSKDKGSDWWYGTSLSTNQVGFFPRTYVEVIEEAFRVKTLYAFTKNRPDDLEFTENEVIVVQPFQDENSDWWYGTNEDTEESGYFPKTYVEKIDSASTNYHISPSSTSMSIPIGGGSSHQNKHHPGGILLTVTDHDFPRGLSAPNTPIMKKANLGVDKAQLSKRRRAASSVSTANNSHISTPQLIFPRSGSVSENLELLTWASTMDPIELEAILPEERKRQEAIFELIATERSYLNDLQMIINIFYADSAKYLSQDERDVVFSNIDDLLICNTALLSDMETRQNEKANVVDKIGDVFLRHADGLQCYSTYCRNQSYATKFLQKKREDDQWFEVFLKTAQTRVECRSLDLSHFLLEPVQRITRYPLLLRQILNNTPKKHPDYALVRSGLSIAQKVLEDVNEETRRFENIQKMSELSRILDMESTDRLNIPGREFVMDGALFKSKSGRKLHGFLFNDVLILAEPLKSLSQKGYLYSLYREPMPIDKVSVRQQQTMALKSSFTSNTDDLSFQIVYGSQVIAVRTSSASHKRQWMNQIQHYSALQQYK
ncbi:hypothetical protein EDC94DRAFT_593478 [Helicostylum pulchrum]|uniref:Uncharacterized protein n=1 Tax=Helicostylum pulchrum TaxID=562976 RepID=A0ABP9XW90_9FUNG|nr:hypothetical protein EDC94DRAFT_593478 [Helicostylum pulchrum]